MSTANPLINYHHNSYGGTKYNGASHCHSYILLLLSNLMPSPGSSSLQWCLYLLHSARSPWRAAPWPGWGSPPLPTFLNFHQQEGEQHLQLSKEVFALGQEGRAWDTAAEVSVASCAAAAQDSSGARAEKHTQLPVTSTDLTVDPAAQAPLLLGNALNSNTRPLQFCYREIGSLQILLHHTATLL